VGGFVALWAYYFPPVHSKLRCLEVKRHFFGYFLAAAGKKVTRCCEQLYEEIKKPTPLIFRDFAITKHRKTREVSYKKGYFQSNNGLTCPLNHF